MDIANSKTNLDDFLARDWQMNNRDSCVFKPLGCQNVDETEKNITKNITDSQSIETDVYSPSFIKEISLYRTAAYSLLTYVLPLIIFIGAVGNTLSVFVLLGKRMRNKSIYFYLIFLSIADTLVLVVSALKTWIRVISGFEFLHVSSGACKLLIFLLLLSQHMSAWIIVLVTIDRFIAVWLPFRVASACSMSRARLAVCLLSTFVAAYNLHVFWTFHLIPRSDTNLSPLRCGPHQDNRFMTQYYHYLNFISYSVVPFGIVLILNICIIVKIAKSSQLLSRANVSETNDVVLDRQQSHRRVTYMLLSISFTWLLLTLPHTVYNLTMTENSKRISQEPQQFLAKAICFLLMYSNHSINFFLYCVTGKRFRRELVLRLNFLRRKWKDFRRRTTFSRQSADRFQEAIPFT